MTNDLERTFFDTFGIEPKHKCADGALETCDEQCNECGYYELRYPQITDTHYLKLIAIMSKELAMIVNLLEENLEDLKSEILKKMCYELSY